MFVTNLKEKRSSHSSKSKCQLHGEEQPQQWREGPKRAPLFSGWKRGGRRGRLQPFVLQAYHHRFLARTNSDRAQSLSALGLKGAVMSGRQNTAGSSHKPTVMWSFTASFSPTLIIFFIFKLITGSEGTSLPVVTNPAVMRPTVMSKFVEVQLYKK